jgi:hypothetical protein
MAGRAERTSTCRFTAQYRTASAGVQERRSILPMPARQRGSWATLGATTSRPGSSSLPHAARKASRTRRAIGSSRLPPSGPWDPRHRDAAVLHELLSRVDVQPGEPHRGHRPPREARRTVGSSMHRCGRGGPRAGARRWRRARRCARPCSSGTRGSGESSDGVSASGGDSRPLTGDPPLGPAVSLGAPGRPRVASGTCRRRRPPRRSGLHATPCDRRLPNRGGCR